MESIHLQQLDGRFVSHSFGLVNQVSRLVGGQLTSKRVSCGQSVTLLVAQPVSLLLDQLVWLGQMLGQSGQWLGWSGQLQSVGHLLVSPLDCCSVKWRDGQSVCHWIVP